MVDSSLIRSDTFILFRLYRTTKANDPADNIITSITTFMLAADSLVVFSICDVIVTFTTSLHSISFEDISSSLILLLSKFIRSVL